MTKATNAPVMFPSLVSFRNDFPARNFEPLHSEDNYLQKGPADGIIGFGLLPHRLHESPSMPVGKGKPGPDLGLKILPRLVLDAADVAANFDYLA